MRANLEGGELEGNGGAVLRDGRRGRGGDGEISSSGGGCEGRHS